MINGNTSDPEMDAAVTCNHLEENTIVSLPSLLKKVDSENCRVPKLPLPLYTVVYNNSCVSSVNISCCYFFLINRNLL